MKPPTFMECSVCGREFGSKSIAIHERQCLQKLRRTEINSEVQSAPTVPVKTRKKKKTLDTISIDTPKDRSPEPPSQQIILPKIATTTPTSSSSGFRSTKIVRPTTATLSKPKFLNPDYIQHDMSLTRIDYTTAQLRLNDEEICNNVFNNHDSLILPAVNSFGLKSKQQTNSSGKGNFSEKCSTLKLPDSMKMLNPNFGEFSSSQKSLTEASFAVVLPSNQELSTSYSIIHPYQKSSTFPYLSTYPSSFSSDFIMKRMNGNQTPFPQIDRNAVESNYFLTQHHQHPQTVDWDDDEEDFTSVRDGNRDLDGANEAERNTTSCFYQSDEELSKSTESSVIYKGNNSIQKSNKEERYESELPLLHTQHRNNNVSFAIPISTSNLETIPFAKTQVHDCCSAEFLSLKSILKHQTGSSDEDENSTLDAAGHQPPQSRSGSNLLRDAGTFSGSDCDNEDTSSSGYCIYRFGSTGTLLRKRKKQRKIIPNLQTYSPQPQSTLRFAIEYLNPTYIKLCGNKLEHVVQRTEHKNRHHRSRFSKADYEKIQKWLDTCDFDTPVVLDDRVNFNEEEQSIVNLYDIQYQNIDEVSTIGQSAPLTNNIAETKEYNKKEMQKKPRSKFISGLVSAIFKVKEKEETRIYKFVNKIDTTSVHPTLQDPFKEDNKINSMRSTELASKLPQASQSHEAPPVNVELKNVPSSRDTKKRPQTVPSNYSETNIPVISSTLKRPKTSEANFHHKIQIEENIINEETSVVHPELKFSNPVELKFGPQPVKTRTTSECKPKSVVTSMKKQRPLTPRPSYLNGHSKPQLQNKTEIIKVDKDSQFPLTRSSSVQCSPILQEKLFSHSTEPNIASNETKRNRDSKKFEIPHKNSIQNQIIPELAGENSAYLSHFVYQFHSIFKDVTFEAEMKYGAKIPNISFITTHKLSKDDEIPTINLHTTYTLLVPKKANYSEIIDLNVMIRRRNIGESQERLCELEKASMYLIIDEEREISSINQNFQTKSILPKSISNGTSMDTYNMKKEIEVSTKTTHDISPEIETCKDCRKVFQAHNLKCVYCGINKGGNISKISYTDSITQTYRDDCFEGTSCRPSSKCNQKSCRVNDFPSFFPL